MNLMNRIRAKERESLLALQEAPVDAKEGDLSN
jgi:hypothetical protein